MSKFPFLAQQLFNVPLLLLPEKAEIIVSALADRLGVTHFFHEGKLVFGPGKSMNWDDDYAAAEDVYQRGYDVCDGIAQIAVKGTLVQRLGTARPYSGMTGYDGIRAAALNAYADPVVRAVSLNIDSPGGTVSNCFDLVDTLTLGRSLKPTWAVLNETACSAAYAIASAASRIVLPRTGTAGSIGVVCMHTDLSGALAKEGVAVTLIHYGARKVDANTTQPLADPAKARLQDHVNQIGEIFVKTVARNRALSTDAVRDTQADVYMGQEAVDIGLADAVMAPDEAHRALLATL